MRRLKADLAIIVFLFVSLFALTAGQCLFCVSAEGENAPSFLISDYYSFTAPTKVAAWGESAAVFDDGKIVVIRKDSIASFPVSAKYCYALCASEENVFLLCGESASMDSSAKILRYSLSGEKLEFDPHLANVTDIALSGKKLFALSDMKEVYVFDFSGEGDFATSFSLPSMPEWSMYLYAEGETLFFRTLFGKILKREAGEYSEIADVASGLDVAARNFAVEGGSIFYLKDETVYKGNLSKSFLPVGEKDDKVGRVCDFALAGDSLFVIDASYPAVKVFSSSDGAFSRFVGSFGKNVGRLKDPTALSVKDGVIAVADKNERITIFGSGSAKALGGYPVGTVGAIANAGDAIYAVNGESLLEFRGLLFEREYALEGGSLTSVAATADGSIFASAGKTVYVKKSGTNEFVRLRSFDALVENLSVGIGGKVVYAYSGGVIRAFTQDGDPLSGSLTVPAEIRDFAVDYRGNMFLLTESGRLIRYYRTLGGYFSPTELPIGNAKRYGAIEIGKDGTVYLTADHNVARFKKSVFGVVTEEDSDFKDEAPIASPVFVCAVKAESSIAYVAPDNFEDVTYLPKGKKLVCFASLVYAGNEYLRVETEKGIAYLPKEDATVFSEAVSPIRRARCLHTKKGVNLYRYPSYIEIEKGVEPLFRALGKEEIFEVNAVVAVNESGADEWGFYRVSYNGESAYALISDVVSVDDEPEPIHRYKVKIKAEKLGMTVILYKDASVDSEEAARLSDGTEIYALEPLNKENEFTKVLYKGKTCYALTRSLGTGGLSGGQTLAIVIFVVTVTASIATALILRAGKRRRKIYKE
ncbi:MAG: hypothetical protein K5753_03945 [Clostridia bacterium]|nr:hypothetical protein [Clostridia bacterium]